MIQNFVTRWELNKDKIRACFDKHPDNYKDVVKIVTEHITAKEYGEDALDPERIHQIDDGDYQGTLLFVIAAKGYQPDTYYSVYVSYGSCSGCDTLESIKEYSDDLPTEEQKDKYMMLALHIVQKLKRIE